MRVHYHTTCGLHLPCGKSRGHQMAGELRRCPVNICELRSRKPDWSVSGRAVCPQREAGRFAAHARKRRNCRLLTMPSREKGFTVLRNLLNDRQSSALNGARWTCGVDKAVTQARVDTVRTS